MLFILYVSSFLKAALGQAFEMRGNSINQVRLFMGEAGTSLLVEMSGCCTLSEAYVPNFIPLTQQSVELMG